MTTIQEMIDKRNLEESSSLVGRLEKFHGKKIKGGRVTIKGYPVDIDDSSDGSFIGMDAVDRDAARELVKLLRKGGFKARREGNLGIVIEETIEESGLDEGVDEDQDELEEMTSNKASEIAVANWKAAYKASLLIADVFKKFGNAASIGRTEMSPKDIKAVAGHYEEAIKSMKRAMIVLNNYS